jgi:hypothetical protein
MKHNKRIRYKNITFCCQDCGNQISYKTALYEQGRCPSCAKTKMFGVLQKNITFCCKDCGTKISCNSALFGQGRCCSCAKQGKLHSLFGKKHSLETKLKMSDACKGKNHYLFGKHRSLETRLKIRKSQIGKKISKETRLKIAKSRKGKPLSKETKLKLSKILSGKNNHNFGKKHSKETRFKISKALTGKKRSLEIRLQMSKTRKGKNNGNWRGGVSYFPYTQNFSKALKVKIKTRDSFTCQHCELTEKEHIKRYKQGLHIHHVDYNKENCKKTNLITTCIICNSKANSNRDYWFAYYTYIIEHFKELVSTFPTLR